MRRKSTGDGGLQTALAAADVIATETRARRDSELELALAGVRDFLGNEQCSGIDAAISE